MNKADRPTLKELFEEFRLTQSPFERWKLFKFFEPRDAMLVYMPGQSQSGLCMAQELIFTKMIKGNEEERSQAITLMKWMTDHRTHLMNVFKTCKPFDFWHDFSFLTSGEIKEAAMITQDLFIVFNIKNVFSTH